MSGASLCVGLVQLTATADFALGVEKAEAGIEEAARQGAAMVALPEVFAFLGPEDDKLRLAERLDGPTLTRLSRAARRLGVWLLAGSISERIEGEPRVYNTSVLYDAGGTARAVYRKIHLFDVDLPGAGVIRESATVQPGRALVTADTPWGVAGLSICYDLRFPELYRGLADRGCRMVFVPAAFTATTGKDHWEVLLRARAIENQCFVVAPGQWGHHSPTRSSHGRSMVVDPWGTVVACAPDAETVVVTHLDLGQVDRVRRRVPALEHRVLPFAVQS